MKNKRIQATLKATILAIIVAFLISFVISILAIKFGKEEFLKATDLIDVIAMDIMPKEERPVPELELFKSQYLKDEITVLMNCPVYGQNYATLKIPSIGVDLPIYYGESLDLLKKGIGHDKTSYFPGEGGSVVLMGHNYKRFLGKLPDAQLGDTIQISTNYGEFTYTIFDRKIVKEMEVDKVPVQDQEEILMIYTCWPINNIGYATERYVIYAK